MQQSEGFYLLSKKKLTYKTGKAVVLIKYFDYQFLISVRKSIKNVFF